MKAGRILLLKEALEDLEDGKLFYDSHEAGIGDYFQDSLISDIESLYLYAGIHGKVEGFYKMYSKRFPYAIYYSFEDNIIKIVAILPLKRDPLWINKKISGR